MQDLVCVAVAETVTRQPIHGGLPKYLLRHTARSNVGKINVHTLPVILDWLQRHEIEFDEVVVGKPWCGREGFYVDDRALRPDEFARMTPEEVARLIGSCNAQ